jgi:hypothetical protein
MHIFHFFYAKYIEILKPFYRVALRVRPLTQKEQYSNCTECISFIPNQPQILIGKDHSFTYDYVFDTNSIQQSIYETSVVPLAEKFVDG